MKQKILFFAFLLISITLFCQTNTNLLKIEHKSEILNKTQTFRIYIPPCIEDSTKRYPVLYVLHGAWCDSSAWPLSTKILEKSKNFPFILVFPDGSKFGWYLNSPQEENSQYESYIIKELIPMVDRTFPTIAARSKRSIMGASMGGHGALLLATKHPELFCSVSTFYGILDITKHPDNWHLSERLGPYSENKDAWEANSVWHTARSHNLKDAELAIYFDCGSSDDETQTGAIYDNRAYHKLLIDLKIRHIWKELPGGHTGEFLNTNVKDHLDFHWSHMK